VSPYPLPGEIVTRTLRHVEFGCARPRDEPAPRDIAAMFRAMQEAFDELGSAHQHWMVDHARAAFTAYKHALDYYESMHAALMRALRRRPGRCYVCDGCRFWLFVEPDGCRRNVLRIEEKRQ
jgi:hypothetical protein